MATTGPPPLPRAVSAANPPAEIPWADGSPWGARSRDATAAKAPISLAKSSPSHVARHGSKAGLPPWLLDDQLQCRPFILAPRSPWRLASCYARSLSQIANLVPCFLVQLAAHPPWFIMAPLLLAHRSLCLLGAWCSRGIGALVPMLSVFQCCPANLIPDLPWRHVRLFTLIPGFMADQVRRLH